VVQKPTVIGLLVQIKSHNIMNKQFKSDDRSPHRSLMRLPGHSAIVACAFSSSTEREGSRSPNIV
jgi:hypothetical protein